MAGRCLVAPLLVLNLCMYMIVLGIAGWALNREIDGQGWDLINRGMDRQSNYGNTATYTFLLFALIAGVVGIASILAGLHHLKVWKAESLGAGVSSALISWLLTLLAFGLACKEIHSGPRGHRLKTLEAFVIILAATQLLYLLLLHAGLVNNRYGPGNRDITDPGYGGHAGEPHKMTTDSAV